MKDLPEGWVRLSLGEVGTWSSGGTPSRQNPAYFGPGIPWIKSGDLPDGVITQTEEQITPLGLLNSSAKVMPAGTISLALYGATIGRLGVLTFPGATNQACANVVPNAQLMDPQYLFFYLLSERDALIEKGQGGAQPNISQQIVKSHPILLAPLSEQHRIVAKLEKLLSRVNAAQGRLDTIPRILKRFRQYVLAAACSGRLTTDWRATHPTESSSSKYTIEDAYTPEIPVSWSWRSFGEVAEVVSNLVDPDRFPNLPLIAPDNIEKGSGRLLNYKTVSEIGPISPKHRFYPNQIIYSKIRPYLSKLVVSSFEGLCSADMYPINSRINISYLFYYMLSDTFLGFVDSSGTRTLLPKINQKELAVIPVPVPPSSEQQEIAVRVEALFKMADGLEARYRTAKAHVDKLTQSILAKAFRGELVPQDPNDEPASVLLERIRSEKNGNKPKRRNRPK